MIPAAPSRLLFLYFFGNRVYAVTSLMAKILSRSCRGVCDYDSANNARRTRQRDWESSTYIILIRMDNMLSAVSEQDAVRGLYALIVT